MAKKPKIPLLYEVREMHRTTVFKFCVGTIGKDDIFAVYRTFDEAQVDATAWNLAAHEKKQNGKA